MTDKKIAVASFCINILIFLITTGIVVSYFLGNDGEYHIDPLDRFNLFTTDSNIVCAAASLVIAIFDVKLITGQCKVIPFTVQIIKYIGTVSVFVTFIVVLTFLGPKLGYINTLFMGTSVYMHLLGPLLAILSFCVLDQGRPLKKIWIFPGAATVFVYGVYYLIRYVFNEPADSNYYDFYGFNIGGFWYISFIVMNAAAVGLAAVVRLLHNIQYKISGRTKPLTAESETE